MPAEPASRPDGGARVEDVFARVVEPVVTTFTGALPGIVAVAVYGSVVTGDFIEGFSDLDLQVVLPGPLSVEQAIMLQRQMPEPPGVAYIQLAFSVRDRPVAHLIPGAFRVEHGELPSGFIATEETLRRSSTDTVRELPSLIEDDARAWVGAIGEKRPRHVRLMVTRLKPAVRATLVELGEPVVDVWRTPWDGLVDLWRDHDGRSAAELAEILRLLHAHDRDDRACGERVLRLLERIAGSDPPGTSP